MRLLERGLEIKTAAQVEVMREAGLVVAETLELLRAHARAGTTTLELDALAADHIASRGAVSNFLGYHGFPGTICTSVNDQVVHGIPSLRVLRDGDIVSLDCGAVVNRWHGDAAITVAVGDVSAEVRELVAVCEEALWRGIAAVRPGGRVGDISHAVESSVRARPGGDAYGIVEDFVGHGIGSAMHMPPDVPNRGRAGRGPRLVPGLVLAVEPMVTAGSTQTRTLDDDWTEVTVDGSWSTHAEHTVAVTQTGAWVLTAPDGGRARLEAMGLPFGGRD